MVKGQAHTVAHPHILVGLTRVQDLSFVRSVIQAPQHLFCLQYIFIRSYTYKLSADCEMLAFLHGFDIPDHKWSPTKAHKALWESCKTALHKAKPQRNYPSTPSKFTESTPTSPKHRTSEQQPRTPTSPAPPSSPYNCPFTQHKQQSLSVHQYDY